MIEPATGTLNELKTKMLGDKKNKMFVSRANSFMYSTNNGGGEVAHFEAVVSAKGKIWRLHDGGTQSLFAGANESDV